MKLLLVAFAMASTCQVAAPSTSALTADGSTDVTAQVQWLLDHAQDVYLPPGRYAITQLRLHAGQWLHGAGDATVLVGSSGAGEVVVPEGADGVRVSSLALDVQHRSNYWTGFYVQAPNVSLDHLHLYDSLAEPYGTGYTIHGVLSSPAATGLVVDHCRDEDVQVKIQGSHTTVEDLDVAHPSNFAVSAVIESPTQVLQDIVIRNVRVTDPVNGGAIFVGSDYADSPAWGECDNLRVTDNVITGAMSTPQVGAIIARPCAVSTGWDVSDNLVDVVPATWGNSAGIDLLGQGGSTLEDVIVSGNTVRGPSYYGVAVGAEVLHQVIVANNVARGAEHGIFTAGTGELLLANNYGTP